MTTHLNCGLIRTTQGVGIVRSIETVEMVGTTFCLMQLMQFFTKETNKFNLCESNGLNILYYTTIEVPKLFNHEYFDKNKILKVLNGLVNLKKCRIFAT